jgi:hypothetical protein
MKLTRKERELLMNEKYYIHLEEIKPSEFVYGIMGVVENSPFDYEISKMYGKREDVLNNISKKIIKENKLGIERNVFNLRYSELSDAKTMQYNLKYDDFYKNQRVNVTPAVFLSDMDKVGILSKMVQKNALQEQMIANSKYGLIR